MQIIVTSILLVVATTGVAFADGKQAFLDHRCDRCHAVSEHGIEATAESESMHGPDLSDVGKERDAAWLEKYLAREIELDGKRHRSTFRGTGDDRRAIAAWLAEQDSP